MSLQEEPPGTLILGASSVELGMGGGSCGLAERLVGVEAPALELPWTAEAKTSLAELGRRRSLVVFFYPGVQTRTSGDEEADVDTIRAWAWRDHESELRLLDHIVVGVSTQSVEAQMQWASLELLDYMLLSDSELKLAHVLGLPTTRITNQRAFDALTLIVRNGRIVHVFYPIDPVHDAEIVTDRIRRIHA